MRKNIMIEFDMILNDLVFCVFLKKSNFTS